MMIIKLTPTSHFSKKKDNASNIGEEMKKKM
jgi:hypothetical protein